MKTILASLLVFAWPAVALAQSDAQKTATQLWGDGSRLEGEKEYAKALDKYRKALDKAKAGDLKETAAKCLVGIGRCSEELDANVSDALAAYKTITSEYGDQADQAKWAEEKIRLNGVDVHVRFFARAVAAWRDKERNNPFGLDEKKKETWAKIQPLDKEAIYGLTDCLKHPDENVRLFVAVMLAEVIDEGGVANLVTKLGDKTFSAGAALALAKTFDKWNQAKGFDDDAERIKAYLSTISIQPLPQTPEWEAFVASVRTRANEIKAAGVGGKVRLQNRDYSVTQDDVDAANKALQRMEDLTKSWGDMGRVQGSGKGNHEKNLARAGELNEKAKAIRHNIPASLSGATTQQAFAAVIADEAADPTGRQEALKCLASIGELNGAVVDAILGALKSGNRNVRRAACIASGSVDTSKSEDKHKLVTRLLEIVEYVAEADDEKKDPANDDLVREAACEALGRIGVIRSIPSLIKALNDNASIVRYRANQALVMITSKDFGYESDPHVSDPKRELTTEQKKAKQVELRKQAIQKWEQWWGDTGGIVVLVERFYRFAASWKTFPPAKLFDKDAFVAEVDSQSYAYMNPMDTRERASRACDEFSKIKNFHVQDGVDVGANAVEKLMKYLSGMIESDPKKIGAAATRMFVGETLAKIAEKTGASTIADQLGDRVGGGSSAEEKAGAAVALGFMSKGSVTGGARSALESRGLTAEAVVKQAAAWALARVGDPSSSGKPLADMAANPTEDAEAAVAALRAIAALKPQGEDVVNALSGLIGDEPEPGTTPKKRAGNDVKDDLVRATACDALGEIASDAAVKNLGLLRARRDTSVAVRDAARKALAKVVQKNASVSNEIVAVLKNLQAKADDRRGAALALGTADQAVLASLLTSLIDEDPPLKLRDPDAAVRASVCMALGELKEKARAKSVGDALLYALENDISEEVRREAYIALGLIGGDAPPEYSATDTQEVRSGNVMKIKQWVEMKNWPEVK